jgi:hypothetical protein
VASIVEVIFLQENVVLEGENSKLKSILLTNSTKAAIAIFIKNSILELFSINHKNEFDSPYGANFS